MTTNAPEPGTRINVDGRTLEVADEPLRAMFGRVWFAVFEVGSPVEEGCEWWPVEGVPDVHT